MIIQQSKTDIKKFITGIILASLLINFSLFFTKVLIDASNVVTIGIYQSIIIDTRSEDAYGGLSNAYQQSLGTQGFMGTENIIKSGSLTDDNYNKLLVLTMASILVLVTSFVFFAISVMFVVRYIVLIILLTLSPIAYMGLAGLPGIKKHADEWWESLWGQLLFAPIFMIMTWVILTLITSPGFTGMKLDPKQWTAFASAEDSLKSTGFLSLFFNFSLIIGLTIMSLVIAKKFATQGASQIKAFSSWTTASAGGLMFGGAARFGRNTIGRAGNVAANSEYLKEKSVTGGMVSRNLAKLTLVGGSKAATNSFDARSNSGFESLVGATGVKFGKGEDSKKVNFQKDLEEKAKKQADYAKSLKPTDDAMREKEVEQKKLDKSQENAKSDLDKSIQKIKDLKDREGRLRENVNKVATNEEREKIRNEIVLIEEQTKNEQLGLDKLKQVSSIATEKAKKHKDEMDDIYKNRVEKYAQIIENESKILRYTKNAFKAPLSVISPITPTTKGDNREIARKIRGVLKENKKMTKKDLKDNFNIELADEPKEDNEPKKDDETTQTNASSVSTSPTEPPTT